MTFIPSIILKISLLIAAIGGIFISRKYFNAKDDNAVEEVIEELIRQRTSIDIDLTPDSAEDEPSLQIVSLASFVAKESDKL